MDTSKAISVSLACALLLSTMVVAQDTPPTKFDGTWNTHMACEAHGEMPSYAWDFPSSIKGAVFHGQHSAEGEPGYLVIDGAVRADGIAKLEAKGTVTQSHARGVFAMKGNNYGYTIKAQFTPTSGTGKRDEGVGILGRPCTFEFTKQQDGTAAPSMN